MKLWNSFRSVFQTGVCLSLFLLHLTGCGIFPASRSRIVRYVECMGISGYTVSEQAQKTDHDEGNQRHSKRSDYLWTVTERDGTQFQVLNYHSSCHDTPYRLIDNFNSVHIKRYMQQADCSGFTLQGDVSDFFYGVWLQGSFRTRGELHCLVDRLNALAADCPPGLYLPYYLKYEHPYRIDTHHYVDKALRDWDYGDRDCRGSRYGLKTGEKLSYAEGEENMLKVAISMRYESDLRDFTETEIRAFVRGSKYTFGARQADGSYISYDDLLMEPGGGAFTFPTVYEILKRNGWQVSGTPSHYSFKGLDGHTYEFSNNYMENGASYFLKDGHREPNEFEGRRSISLERLQDLSGIECKSAVIAEAPAGLDRHRMQILSAHTE